MTAVDTNILLYVHDSRDLRKRAAAAALVSSLVDGVLLWQVACEYLANFRKVGHDPGRAWGYIRELRRAWGLAVPGWDVVDRAEALLESHSLSFWDALLIAACLEAGVKRLYSEDFSGYTRVNGLEIMNPLA